MLERPISKAGWTRVAFGDVVAPDQRPRRQPRGGRGGTYVGLEHIDPDDLRIRRWGDEPTDVDFDQAAVQAGRHHLRQAPGLSAQGGGGGFRGDLFGDMPWCCAPSPTRLLPELLPFFMQSDCFMERASSISVGSLSPTINWTDARQQTSSCCRRSRSRRGWWRRYRPRTSLRSVQHDLFASSEFVFKALLKERIGRGFKPADYQGWEEDDEPNMCICKAIGRCVGRSCRFSHRPRNLPQSSVARIHFAQTGDVAAARGRDFSASQYLSEEGCN